MNVEKRVKELVEEKIADRPDLFLVSVNMQANGKLIIHVDGDQGITIQDCAAISRHVGYHLEEENLIQDAYNLEVSSPGIDAPLVLIRQFQKNIGRLVGLHMLDGKKREGRLIQVDNGIITIGETIKEKGKKAMQVENTYPLAEIKETKVLISFK